MDIQTARETHFSKGILCPHCQSPSIHGHGRMKPGSDRQRYKCQDCQRTFSDLTGTPFAYTKKPQSLWLEIANLMREGKSVRKIAIILNIDMTTAFYWRHRILKALREHSSVGPLLSGIVEGDETFFRKSYKGGHFKNPDGTLMSKMDFQNRYGRWPRSRGGTHLRGRSEDQVPVLVLRDRKQQTISKIMQDMKSVTVKATIVPVVSEDSTLCTDSLNVYDIACREAGIAHKKVKPVKGYRVKEGIFHIQNINNYHGRLKNWISRFHGVSTKYLPNYLAWHIYLDATKDVAPLQWEEPFLCSAVARPLDISKQNLTLCGICGNSVSTKDPVQKVLFHSLSGKKTEAVLHVSCLQIVDYLRAFPKGLSSGTKT